MLDFLIVLLFIATCFYYIHREFYRIENNDKNNDNKNQTLEMFPYCDVYYKIDNTPGWKMALFPGTKEEVEEECKKYSDWIDYKVQYSGSYTSNLPRPKLNLNYYRNPDSLYLCTDTIYFQELDRFFMNRDEEIPYPNKIVPVVESIDFNYCFDKDDGEFWCDNDPTDFIDGKEEICIDAYMGIILPENEIGISLQIYKEYIYEEFEQFIEKIKQNKYAIFNVEEYYEYKFLAWVKDDKVRFMIQNYMSNEVYVEILLDVLVDKEQFITKFEQMYNNFKKDSITFRQNFENEIQVLRQKEGIK